LPAAPPGTDFAGEAAQGRKDFRANNDMPPGTQVQHWTKERGAASTGLHPDVMNENLSPLQTQGRAQPPGPGGQQRPPLNGLPATTLLTDPHGGGTSYHVEGGSTYGSEHRFADKYLIPTELERIQNANPNVDPRVAQVEAGRMARWRMEGTPGPEPPASTPPSSGGSSPPSGGGSGPSGGGGFSPGGFFGSPTGRFIGGFGAEAARNFIPGFVEAEVTIWGGGMYLLGAGYGATPVIGAVATAAASAPTAVTAIAFVSGGVGYVVGDAVESIVTEKYGRTAGVAAGTAAGALAGAGTGALLGAAIGSVVPVVGTAVGAVVGGIAGASGGFIGAFW
jgi:hypothetical protein